VIVIPIGVGGMKQRQTGKRQDNVTYSLIPRCPNEAPFWTIEKGLKSVKRIGNVC
jgi:hypothetical protein